MMLKTPKRGSFDYLLRGTPPADHYYTPPPPPQEPPGRPHRVVVNIEVVQGHPRAGRPASVLWSIVRAILAGLLIIFLLGQLAHSAERRNPNLDRGLTPGGPTWAGGSYSYSPDGFTTYTFPQDQSGPDSGHGCSTQEGGDGVVRTNCW